jgi:DEAD/DEAH box helicase domain-containing protein
MNLAQTIDRLRADDEFRRNLTTWQTMPAQPARYGGFPSGLDPRLADGLRRRGISDLYTHQTEAVEAVLAARTCAW